MQNIIKISNSLVALNDIKTDQAKNLVLFIAGISGVATTDKYARLESYFTREGMPLARVDMWQNQSELERSTINYYHQELDAILNYFSQQGFKQFTAIGKSFGATLLISYRNPLIRALTLWAPAIGVTSGEETVSKLSSVELKNVRNVLDIEINRTWATSLRIPICILHGSKDTVVPLQNSMSLAEILSNATMYTLNNSSHSLMGEKDEDELLEKTIAFLKKH